MIHLYDLYLESLSSLVHRLCIAHDPFTSAFRLGVTS